jgi:hypothetical protein
LSEFKSVVRTDPPLDDTTSNQYLVCGMIAKMPRKAVECQHGHTCISGAPVSNKRDVVNCEHSGGHFGLHMGGYQRW